MVAAGRKSSPWGVQPGAHSSREPQPSGVSPNIGDSHKHNPLSASQQPDNLSNAGQSLPPMSHSFSRCQTPVAPPGGSGEWNQLSLIPKLQVSEIPSLTKARWTGPEEPKVVLISPKGERQTHRHRWTDR